MGENRYMERFNLKQIYLNIFNGNSLNSICIAFKLFRPTANMLLETLILIVNGVAIIIMARISRC